MGVHVSLNLAIYFFKSFILTNSSLLNRLYIMQRWIMYYVFVYIVSLLLSVQYLSHISEAYSISNIWKFRKKAS